VCVFISLYELEDFKLSRGRKLTTTFGCRLTVEVDSLRSELQRRLEVPSHVLVERGLRALKTELEQREEPGA
jgi:hypothetical protein